MVNMDSLSALKCHADIYFNSFLKENKCRLIKVNFGDKSSGIKIGNILDISYKTKKFYIKTHSAGQRSYNQSRDHMNYKEMFLYKFFELISLGPEVHFFFNYLNTKDFFIATKSSGEEFYILPEMILSSQNEKRIYLKNLYEADPFYDYSNDCNFKIRLSIFTEEFKKDDFLIKGLILLDLVSKLLNLSDLTANSENYGF